MSKSQPDQGAFTGREYKNAFFGLSLKVPEGWIIQDIELFQEVFAKEDTFHALLFSLSKDQVLIGCVATSLSAYPGVKTASDWIRIIQDQIASRAGMAIDFGEIRSGNLGGQEFKAVLATANLGSAKANQYIYATVINEHILGFFVNSVTTDGFREVQFLLQDIKFER